MKQPAVYILASHDQGTHYIRVTGNLIARTWQHRNHVADGFTKQYGIKHLVWHQQHDSMESAIQREKQLKKWNRAWKARLIESLNPAWKDLWPKIIGDTHDIGKAGYAATGAARRHPPSRE